MKLKILHLEDHEVVSRGIKILIKTEFIGADFIACSNSDEALIHLKENKIDLAIVDLKLKDTLCLDFIKHIVETYPHTKILVFTSYPENIYALRLYKSGIKGFVNKADSIEVISKAIRDIINGKIFYTDKTKELLLQNLGKKTTSNPFHHLSNKEMQVLFFLIKGKNLKEIEVRLNISKSTVSTYKRRIFSKLEISNIAELIEMYSTYDLH